jgi:hypothetical protein
MTQQLTAIIYYIYTHLVESPSNILGPTQEVGETKNISLYQDFLMYIGIHNILTGASVTLLFRLGPNKYVWITNIVLMTSIKSLLEPMFAFHRGVNILFKRLLFRLPYTFHWNSIRTLLRKSGVVNQASTMLLIIMLYVCIQGQPLKIYLLSFMERKSNATSWILLLFLYLYSLARYKANTLNKSLFK